MKTKPVVISVTNDDIDRGIACDHAGCAMAIAVERAIPTCDYEVGLTFINLKPIGNARWEHTVAHKQTEFVEKFDGWKGGLHDKTRPKPIQFEIDVPEYLLPSEPQRPSGQGSGALTVQSPVAELQPK